MSDIAELTNDFHQYKADVAAKFATLTEQIAELKNAHIGGDAQALAEAINALDAEVKAADADLATETI
jgi:hypothetical protein